MSNALGVWVVVLEFESVSLKGILLHSVVIKGADGVEIFSLGEFLEVLNAVVILKDLLDAEEVLSHVVLVLEHTQGAMDLVFVHLIALTI